MTTIRRDWKLQLLADELQESELFRSGLGVGNPRSPTGLRSRAVVPRKEASATAGQIEVPAKYEVLKEGEK